MKVILLQDVARMGRKHEVKDVPDGHAQNYLIPRKLAVPATPQTLKQHDAYAARVETEAAESAEAFAAFLARVEGVPIGMSAPANEQGHLFKGLRAADVAEALTKASGMTIPPSAIVLDRAIKDVGEYPIMIARGGQEGKVVIAVTAQ